MTRIAILGTSGSGKSTLVREIAGRRAWPVIEEDFAGPVAASRELERQIRAGGRADLRTAFGRYAQAGRLWVDQRLRRCRETPDVIADRSCFDILNDWLAADVGRYYPRVLQDMLRSCREESRLIDLYVLLPIGAAALTAGANEDGLPRRTNFGRKLRAQATLIGLLEQCSVAPVLRLGPKEAAVAARCLRVDAALEKLGCAAAGSARAGA